MTIQQTAGKILLTLYYLETENPAKLERVSIVFIPQSNIKLATEQWLNKILHEISNNDTALFNAFKYLLESGLVVNKNNNNIIGGLVVFGLHLTPKGVDTIEGIEQSNEKKQAIRSLFNINVSNNMNVDALIKAEIGNIVGIGGGISGKVQS